MAQRAADQCTGRGLHHSNMQVFSFLRDFDLSYMQDLFELRHDDMQVISSLRHSDKRVIFLIDDCTSFFKLFNSDIQP